MIKSEETIIAELKTQPQKHAERWETYLEHDGYESWLYLEKMFAPGKVKIVISQFIEKGDKDGV